MKSLYSRLLTVGLLLAGVSASQAQNNLVITGPESPTPGTRNTLIGLEVGSTAASTTDNTSVGYRAGYGAGVFSGNTLYGSGAGSATLGGRNTYVGVGNVAVGLSGENNCFVGYGVRTIGPGVSASNTVSIGYYSGYKAGNNNTFVGTEAGYNGSGRSNVLLGIRTGYNSMGNNNVAIGDSAGFNNTVSENVFVGSKAGYTNTTGAGNIFLGRRAGYSNTTGVDNAFTGSYAGSGNITGNQNTFMGAASGFTNLTGSRNTFIGMQAGFNNSGGNDNVFIGRAVGGFNAFSNQSTMVGTEAGGLSRSPATANTFIGYRAGFNTTGQFNTFVGVNAGISNTSGSSNFIMGTNAGSNNTTGTANFFLGDNAGGSNSSGGYNVFLGTNAGVGNTVGANNTAIGFEANVGSGDLVNATAIGFRAVAAVDNSLVLGNGANVGIGTTAPTNKLHVVSGGAGQSGLRLENLTNGTPASVTNQTKFLTVDGSGNVILGSTTSSTRRAAAEDLWELKGDQLQPTSGGNVVIGKGVSRTPAGYKLFVEGGILTEKVKVAVKNTAEWSDHVFAPTYKLAPLAEVAEYIQRYQHLPGVPSAETVVREGMDVTKMNAKLLEKIEELTLYMIELKRENQEQQRQIDQLRRSRRH